MAEHPLDLGDVYNAVAESYTGDLRRDLAERNIPPDLAEEVCEVAAAWASKRAPGAPVAAALGFHLGLIVGVEWARAAR